MDTSDEKMCLTMDPKPHPCFYLSLSLIFFIDFFLSYRNLVHIHVSLPCYTSLISCPNHKYLPSEYLMSIYLISIKRRSLNAQIYVSNKFILKSSNSDLNLEQRQVEVESTRKKVKRLKSEDIFFGILRFRKHK